MPSNNTKNSIHSQRMKSIRPFVNFNYDLRKPLTKYQKHKIKTYFDEIEKLTARPYQIYKPHSKQRLKAAQKFAQHQTNLAGLKVAFIPNPGEKVSIKFTKNNEITVSSKHVNTRLLELDTMELINNPIEHVNEVVGEVPGAKRFTVLAGQYEIPVSLSRERVAEYVKNLTMKYDAEGKNNFHGNWLHGLGAHSFKNQSDFNEYMKSKQTAKRQKQSDRRKAKKREAYRRAEMYCTKCKWIGKRFELVKNRCPKCGAKVI